MEQPAGKGALKTGTNHEAAGRAALHEQTQLPVCKQYPLDIECGPCVRAQIECLAISRAGANTASLSSPGGQFLR
jgi:hypothetical protein